MRIAFLLCSLAASLSARDFTFSGTLKAGEAYEHHLAEHLMFCLCPVSDGWAIEILTTCSPHQPGNLPDFAGVATPPYHGPNPTEINGSFMSPGANAPHTVHRFQFVLTEADCARLYHELFYTDGARLEELLKELARGKASVTITSYKLDPASPDKQFPRFKVMSFTVKLTIP